MNKLFLTIRNFLMLSFLLPFVYGCGGGGGGTGTSSLGSLFSSSPNTLGGGQSFPTGGSDALASVHNPEPATFLLLGIGILAIGYLNGKYRLSCK